MPHNGDMLRNAPTPIGRGEIELSKLRGGPMFSPDEGHDQRVLPLRYWLRARDSASVQANQIPMFLLGPDGKHLLPALLVEFHVSIPGFRNM